MTDAAMSRDLDACVLKPFSLMETDCYIVEATGASVTADSSVGLVYQYCKKLPGDKYGLSFLLNCFLPKLKTLTCF